MVSMKWSEGITQAHSALIHGMVIWRFERIIVDIIPTTTSKYYVYPFKYHPASQIKPQYKKYGITKKLQGLTIPEAIKMLPETPKAETLLKARQFNLLYHWGLSNRSVNRH